MIRKVLTQPDVQQALNTQCFLRFFFVVAIARGPGGISAAITKAGMLFSREPKMELRT